MAFRKVTTAVEHSGPFLLLKWLIADKSLGDQGQNIYIQQFMAILKIKTLHI